MAVYRHIHIDYWQDGFVLDLTPEEKYFYIYIMTNSKTSQCGIYELPKRIIETETGYNRETVDKLLKRFEEYGKIIYCEESKEIFIKNWIKHNKISSPKVIKCVEKELKNIKSEYLVKLFLDECDRYQYPIDSFNEILERVSIPIPKVKINKRYGYGEKQKEKQKENRLGMFSKFYEQNIGLINGVVSEWLIEISERIDIDLFKKAIEIATDKGKCNKGYISGIIKTWEKNNINTIDDYKASLINRGDKNGKVNKQSEYATALEREDVSLYQKPTKEQLREVERLLGK